MYVNYKYKQRSYAHFDKPLSIKKAQQLVLNRRAVARHAFWPLVVQPITTLKRKATPNSKKTGTQRVFSKKKRPIAYAAHSDSHIYSYYSYLLSEELETIYGQSQHLHSSVLAYRKFVPGKSNIDFALNAFREIEQYEECEVLALDVKGFFDNLDHALLKDAWAQLLGASCLPSDHFAVFKASTNSYAITRSKLRDLLSPELPRRRGRRGRALCKPDVFRQVVVPHLQPLQALVAEIKNEKPPLASDARATAVGIPQGLPISATLANLYMLTADKNLSCALKELGGSYRRYSDDILLIVPMGLGSDALAKVSDKLGELKLQLADEKTQWTVFKRNKGRLAAVNADQGQSGVSSSVVSYLGFDFDGVNICLRPSTVSRFMKKAKRQIKQAERTAQLTGAPLKRRKLYTQLTRLGYGQVYGKKVYKRDLSERLDKKTPNPGFFWYARRAAQRIDNNSLSRQLRRIENRIFRLIAQADKRVRNT